VAEEVMFAKICSSINSVVDTANTIFMGDFNMRSADWSIPNSSREIDQSFIETILDLCWSQVVNKPTRGKNILDLIFTGDPSSITEIKVKVKSTFGVWAPVSRRGLPHKVGVTSRWGFWPPCLHGNIDWNHLQVNTSDRGWVGSRGYRLG